MRINQFVAKHLGISRRNADEYVQKKYVKINGTPAESFNRIEGGEKVEVFYKGRWNEYTLGNKETELVLCYKPIFTVTTHSDPEKRRTVFDVIPKVYNTHKTAGRLDYMSEGLLVLSRNGNIIHSLTHPKFKTKKVYLVGTQHILTQEMIAQAARKEIEIDNYILNPVTIVPAKLQHYSYLKPDAKLFWYTFTLSEGRNQQIRKMCKYFGTVVKRLIRIQHGQFTLTPEIKNKGFITTSFTQ